MFRQFILNIFFFHSIGVPLAGEVDHHPLPQIHGVPPPCPQRLMVVSVLQVISAVALLLEVVPGRQVLVVIEPMNLIPMHGVQVLGHHQLLELWHQIKQL